MRWGWRSNALSLPDYSGLAGFLEPKMGDRSEHRVLIVSTADDLASGLVPMRSLRGEQECEYRKGDASGRDGLWNTL